MGSETIEGLALDMKMLTEENFALEVLQSLQILNLKDSHELVEIRNILRVSNLETLILWNCHHLLNVCENLGKLSRLSLLNMTGCRYLFLRINNLAASTSGGVVTKQPAFSFPCSLHRLFLKGCHLALTESFPLSFNVHPYLQYLNLGDSEFESLPCYHHLKNLRVLDLTHCWRLKYLCLPNTLAELYVYDCTSLVKITFESPRFTLQEFGYFHCFRLYEVEGLFKLIPICELDETDLGHMKWLKEYQQHKVCLVGDEGITRDRCGHIQMLYEFNIMSTSLPDIKDPNLRPNYVSKSSSLSFDVPSCPENKRLKGINVTFKYTLSGDDWAWFCKISTANGIVDLMYNPRVFGKTWNDEVGIWLSYWPIGNALDVGATINVSIVVLNGLKVHECGASLVYSDQETMENNLGWEEILGGDLSGFKLSTGAYYLCRRDFFELMEVGRLTSDWFRILVGDTVDYVEVRGWRKTGRPKQVNDPSFTELRTVRCVIDGPQLASVFMINKHDDIYKIPNYKQDDIYESPNYMSETSSLLEGIFESRTISDRYSHVSKTKHFTSFFRRRIPTPSSSRFTSPPSLQIRTQQESEYGTEAVVTLDEISMEESDSDLHLPSLAPPSWLSRPSSRPLSTPSAS